MIPPKLKIKNKNKFSLVRKTKDAIKVELGLKDPGIQIFKFEDKIEEVLQSKNIDYKLRKRYKSFNFNVYICSNELYLDVLDCYWHACQICEPLRKINKTQTANLEKLEEKISLKDINYKFIWEHEFVKNPQVIIELSQVNDGK